MNLKITDIEKIYSVVFFNVNTILTVGKNYKTHIKRFNVLLTFILRQHLKEWNC